MPTDIAAAFDDQSDWTGRVLAQRWYLKRVLGFGGMGTVYEGVRDGSSSAIKVLRPDLVPNRRARQRFLREASIASKVRHPGIVPIIESDVADTVPYLVMELLKGKSLKEMWQEHRGKLSLDDTLRVADSVLDILAATHEQGIIHRDIKPGNVFITLDGSVRVLDFGVARFIEEDGGVELSATRSGATLGTPAFLSPEQARGRSSEVDERTDLWAVGALIYSLLTGHYVHDAETSNEQMILAATQPAPALLAMAPHLPPAVGMVVDRALQLNKNDRWNSARNMQAAIRSLNSTAPAMASCGSDRQTPDSTTPESAGRNPGPSAASSARASKLLPTGATLRPGSYWRIVSALALGLLAIVLGRYWLSLRQDKARTAITIMPSVASNSPVISSAEMTQATRSPGSDSTGISTKPAVSNPLRRESSHSAHRAGSVRPIASGMIRSSDLRSNRPGAALLPAAGGRATVSPERRVPNSTDTGNKAKLEVNDRSLDFRH